MPNHRLNIRRDCTHGGIHQHGTVTAYHRDNCRCTTPDGTGCADARSARGKQHRKQVAYGRHQAFLIDAAPAREHLLELRARGIGWKRAAELAGIHQAVTSKIVAGRQPTCERRTANAILNIPLDADPYPGAYIDGTGSRRRVQALACIGWSFPAQLNRIGSGDRGGMQKLMKGGKIQASTAAAIRAMYDDLWDTPPEPTTRQQRVAVTKTRNLAKAKGWARPLAWDDIDNPDEQPIGAIPEPRKNRDSEDVIEDLDWLHRTGATPEQAAARIGMHARTIAKAAQRHGRKDLATWIETKTTRKAAA